MSTEEEELDRQSREVWKRVAVGWEKWQAWMQEQTAPVSRWMVDAIAPQPGQQVLELAAGPGETGFIAAQRLGPSGTLISSDQSEEMVGVARRRAEELGLENVEFAVLDGQRIELESDRFDAVLCRFGFMLMTDADAALRESRRVLKSGGRVALAAWDTPDRNLWMALPAIQLVARGALEGPQPGEPGPFAMADLEALERRLAGAGFQEIVVDKVEYPNTYASFEQYWEMTHDLAGPIGGLLRDMDADAAAEIREAVRGALSQFEGADGRLAVPASTVLAAATAA